MQDLCACMVTCEFKKNPKLIFMSGYDGHYEDYAVKLSEGNDIHVLGALHKPFNMKILKELLDTA